MDISKLYPGDLPPADVEPDATPGTPCTPIPCEPRDLDAGDWSLIAYALRELAAKYGGPSRGDPHSDSIRNRATALAARVQPHTPTPERNQP